MDHKSVLVFTVLISVSVYQTSSLDIEFTANGGIPVSSPRLQKLLTAAIKKGKSNGESGQDLCQVIVHTLGENPGGSWICFYGHTGAVVNHDNGADGIARFMFEGSKWIVLQAKQLYSPDRVKEANARIESLKKELSDTKAAMVKNKNEHKEYVKKMDAVKATLERILQLKQS